MPFKKLDENEQRQVKADLDRQTGPVTYIENPRLEDDDIATGDGEVFYCKFGRHWDLFNRMFTSFDEACRLVDSTAKDIHDTCTVYSNRVVGPRYTNYGKGES